MSERHHGGHTAWFTLILAVCASCGPQPAESKYTRYRARLACDEASLPPPASQARRLTHAQYDNTIRDVFGIDEHTAFEPDPAFDGFTTSSERLSLSTPLGQSYMRRAEEIAAKVLADPTTRARVISCQPQGDGSTCARISIVSLGRALYRRALSTEDTTRLVALFARGRDADPESATSFDDGMSLVIEAMLQSPRFLYRIELGTGTDEVRRIDPYEIASRLSYTLWNSTPDEALYEKAADGLLGRPEQVAVGAERMLQDPKAQQPMREFHDQLYILSRLDDAPKADTDAWPPGTGAQKRIELETYITDAIFGGQTFTAMMSGGLLTHPALLAAASHPQDTSPILRGVFIQRQVLCTALPEPPPNVGTAGAPTTGAVTTREKTTMHTSPESCQTCHTIINPTGFAFEGYDTLGRPRTEDNGRPIDTSGTIAIDGFMVPFKSADDLGQAIAASDDAHYCYATNLVRYAYGRREAGSDGCTIDNVRTALHDGSILSALKNLVANEAFLSLRKEATP
jgi:hypothetical protein